MSGTVKPMFDLEGKVCVITGGGRGIGKSIASALAAHGATIVITGRTQATLDAAAQEITQAGGKADAIVADVSSEDDVERLVRMVEERHGRADVLVNNAGVNAIYKRAEETSLAEWNEIISTNLTGVFLTCRAFGRLMLDAGAGSIITISSIGGRVGLAKTAPYCASKGGVELLTRSLAIDWAPKGVRVNTVAPAYVETDLTAGLSDHPILAERIIQRTPMRRFARPGEISGAVIFLASDASIYVTGQTIGVDGGWTAA